MNNGVDTNGKWRIVKDIPITVVGFLIVQTISFTWFMAGLNSGLNAVIKDNADSKIIAYTKEDARHEREFQDQKYVLLQSRSDEQLRRINILESAVNEVRARQMVK